MVTDQQVRRLFKLIQTEKNFGIATIKAGMDEKTARKYRKQNTLPSELKGDHVWRTRKDPFGDIWDGMKLMKWVFLLSPLKVYFINGKAKIKIALAKGKRKYDKRETI